jgi:hypothetical protein
VSPIPVAIYDHDCRLEPAYLTDLSAALTVVSQRDFAREQPYGYGLGAACRVVTDLAQVLPGEWLMGLWSAPDVPGALGYHDAAPNGLPVMHVFPLLDTLAMASVTASHELYEALADADINTCVVDATGRVLAREPGDPVEATDYAYACPGGRVLRMTNFVTPAWFCQPTDAGARVPYDFMGLCTAPGEVLDGGYQLVFDPATVQWTQQANGSRRAYRDAVAIASRLARRNARLHAATRP